MGMFDTAKIKTVVAAPAAKKSGAQEVNFGNDLDAMILLITLGKYIEATAKVQRNLMDGTSIIPYLYDQGFLLRKKPANPKAVGNLKTDSGEPMNTASIQFIRKDTRSNLTDDAVVMMAKYNIPVDEHEVRPAGLKVNEKYLGNAKMLARAAELLEGKDGIPEDFIVPVDREIRRVVSDKAHDVIFNLDPAVVGEDTIKQLLAFTTTLKVVPKSKCQNPYEMVEHLRALGIELISGTEE